ncbi:uncharacterized protein LOC123405406 [Hordeum vulgare subsp. vulgare]|uniref:uncharacterized protein LOC123405406 n=1 Tax=Hordeum vulgare subsp. vulgare TaxID=112509 RepID=UPI001D1A4DBB|nr:uncharacterized protein LOC123405406 [Hordeum vulgare subsp. vulgare]
MKAATRMRPPLPSPLRRRAAGFADLRHFITGRRICLFPPPVAARGDGVVGEPLPEPRQGRIAACRHGFIRPPPPKVCGHGLVWPSTRSALAQRLCGLPMLLIECDDYRRQVLRLTSGTPTHPGWVFYKCENDGTCSFFRLEDHRAEQAVRPVRQQSMHAFVAARPTSPVSLAVSPDVSPRVGRGRGRTRKRGRGNDGAVNPFGPQSPHPPANYPAPTPGSNSWTGLFQAWSVAWRAPSTGVLGPRPGTPHRQAMMAAEAPLPAPSAYNYGGAPPGYGSPSVYAPPRAGQHAPPQPWDMASLQAALHSATAGPSSSGCSSDWYLDTCATAHMSSNPGLSYRDGDSSK